MRASVEITIHETEPGVSDGYAVRLYHGHRIREEYTAGGHPLDSQAPGTSDTDVVRAWALDTAKDMFWNLTGREPDATEIEIALSNDR
jgi:hypothetical protein